MDNERKAQITAFIRNQLVRGEQELDALTKDPSTKEKLPTRSAFLVLNQRIREYIVDNNKPNWIAVPGLRATGKTTLLAQLYGNLDWPRGYKLYVSLDQAKSLGFSLKEILDVYKELIAKPLSDLPNPVILFLDEIQYEEDWGLTLKVLTDKPNKVFVMCTGSSSLSLYTDANVARRITYERLFPLSFFEYNLIKNKVKPTVNGFCSTIRNAILNSRDSKEVYQKLKTFEPWINKYISRISPAEVDTYLKYGSLPFSFHLPNEALIYARINQTLNTVLAKDVPQLNEFDKNTIDKLSQILYAVAGSNVVSFQKIADLVGLNRKTIAQIFDVFEKTGVLNRIYPHGSHYRQVNKASKYLFTSSAYRAMYHNLAGSVEDYTNYKGKLLEDVIGMYLSRIFEGKGTAITYDNAEGGADFILSNQLRPNESIALEVGSGKKDCRQVQNTLAKITGKYGLVVSNDELYLNEDKNCVFVPKEYFLLMC